jgi:hypothetical protein
MWADMDKYFNGNNDAILSQTSVYDRTGSKVKLLRDHNNYFVLAHGSSYIDKGGAIDIEENQDIWLHKLIAMNTHVMCIALIYLAFYSGVLNDVLVELLSDLFKRLENPNKFGTYM